MIINEILDQKCNLYDSIEFQDEIRNYVSILYILLKIQFM